MVIDLARRLLDTKQGFKIQKFKCLSIIKRNKNLSNNQIIVIIRNVKLYLLHYFG